MAIRFDNSAYVNVHGKAPRGRGRWAFADNKNPAHDDPTLVFTPYPMTLGEAQRWMKNYLATTPPSRTYGAPMYVRGDSIVVYVLP